MAFASSRTPAPAAPQKRKVRIVKPRIFSRAGAVSLAMAGGAALLIIITRLLVRTEEVVRPYERTVVDYQFEWKCEQGHSFSASGQIEPRPCWTCSQPAYPVTKFTCSTHGTFDVSVRFAKVEDGSIKPVEYRPLGTKDWVPVAEGALCPRCKRVMERVNPEPLVPPKKREPRREERP